MRALLERSTTVRVGVAVVAAACILGLVHAAEAGDDLGIRRATFFPEGLFTALGLVPPPSPQGAAPASEPVPASARASAHRRPRRIWAAARGRPLRIALARPRRRQATRTALRASPHHGSARPVEALRLVPPPVKTALVSIFDDRTLKSGDAVMLGDGLHVFRDDGFWPHRPRDFVRLRSVAGLDWHLRKTLQPYDANPPTRWTAIMMPPA